MKHEQRPRLQRRGIYLLPNLFTTLALFFGFYAIVAAIDGRFNQACLTIFIAMICDSLDGRIARMTNTTSPFGAEYDSLSDLVTFGLAPALLTYKWSLHSLGKVGWLIAFVYVAATALRLARFNTLIGVSSKKYFKGMPCPAAAAVLASFIWAIDDTWNIDGTHLTYLLAVITVSAAAVMVSNVNFYSFKDIDWRGRVPFVMILIFILICVAIALDPPPVLFGAFMLYMLSGPVMALWNITHKKKLTAKVTRKK